MADGVLEVIRRMLAFTLCEEWEATGDLEQRGGMI